MLFKGHNNSLRGESTARMLSADIREAMGRSLQKASSNKSFLEQLGDLSGGFQRLCLVDEGRGPAMNS